MKKIIILISVGILLLIVFFIPVTQQKTLIIKSSFLNVYNQLENPGNWEKWRPELRKAMKTDSDKIVVHKDSVQFTIKYARLELDVKPKGNSFDINEDVDGKSTNYSFV